MLNYWKNNFANWKFLFLCFYLYFIFFKFYFIFKLYIIVLVLPNIKMNPPQVYIYKKIDKENKLPSHRKNC